MIKSVVVSTAIQIVFASRIVAAQQLFGHRIYFKMVPSCNNASDESGIQNWINAALERNYPGQVFGDNLGGGSYTCIEQESSTSTSSATTTTSGEPLDTCPQLCATYGCATCKNVYSCFGYCRRLRQHQRMILLQGGRCEYEGIFNDATMVVNLVSGLSSGGLSFAPYVASDPSQCDPSQVYLLLYY